MRFFIFTTRKKHRCHARHLYRVKANFLSFPFIYFSESGLFNGLQPIQIKKLLVLFRLRDVLSARLAQTSFPILFRPHEIRSTETYNTCFCFFQAIAGSHSVSCWQEIPHVVAARDGPEASWPGLSRLPTRFGAGNDGKGR